MKALFLTSTKRAIRILMVGSVLSQATIERVHAQSADCSSGTVMYAIFNDSTGSGTNAPSEIRPVNYATGAVGALMGGVSYLIKKGSFYGSASLGVDPITKRFYVNSQMGSGAGAQKDFISINTATGTMVVIATTPSAVSGNIPVVLSDYHFVKMAFTAAGLGFAVGVHRDTTVGSFVAAQCSPLISFTSCGAAPIANCSTITLLGFLPYTGNFYNLFNGDIAFDNAGNLYFATAGFAKVGTIGRYTDARLYKIAAANIPTVPGTGTIPMSFVADYNTLDSTVVNGITLDPLGRMYITTRRYPAGQNAPALYVNELYKSTVPGTATVMPGFSVPTSGYSVADLGGCYFPLGVLAQNELTLNTNYVSGIVSLRWQVNSNDQVEYYEVQRSTDDQNYETVAKVDVKNANSSSQVYTAMDKPQVNTSSVYYRIREVMASGVRFYSNVVKVNVNAKVTLLGTPNPNPFKDKFVVSALLRVDNMINVKIADQGGRIVYEKRFDGRAGSNVITVSNLSNLNTGIYLVEIKVDDETIHEKLMKQ
jgi:hypothetical protein